MTDNVVAIRDTVTGMTPQEEIFCQRIALFNDNASQAYKEAYSCGNRRRGTILALAGKLRKKNHIQVRILELRNARIARMNIDADWVLQQAAKGYLLNAAPLIDEQGNVQMINASAATKFLDQVGKHVDIQAFKEKVELEVGPDLAAIMTAARTRLEQRDEKTVSEQ